MTKKPFSQWTERIAWLITPITAALPSGVRKPVASVAPPAASDVPAISALRFPGLRPIDSRPFAMPSNPGPPNQPNSFCAPCAKKIPPRTVRSAVMPSLMSGIVPGPARDLTREQPLESERERLACEVVHHVQREPGARVVDRLGGLVER